jgi:hypothetical protein
MHQHFVTDPYKRTLSWIAAISGLIRLNRKVYKRMERFLALVRGATEAKWIVAIGKWIIILMWSWPVNLESERWFEFLSAMTCWVGIIVALMIPSWCNPGCKTDRIYGLY